MSALTRDIRLDQEALARASEEMAALKTRTENLRTTLEKAYKALQGALDTPAGHQVEYTASSVLLKPIDNLALVINHVSATPDEIKGGTYYGKVFTQFDELNNSIQ